MSNKLRIKKKTASGLFTPTIVISLFIIIIVIFSSVFASAISKYSPDTIDLSGVLQNPSLTHLLGTDNAGRDVFTRLLYGGRTTLLGGPGVTLIVVIAGIPLGLLCGYYRGIFDTIIMRLWDINLAIPTLLLAFVLVESFGKNLVNLVIALGIIYLPMITRLTRSLVLSEKNKTYVEAARSLGYSDRRILFLHIFPNCIETLVVQITVTLAQAILDLAALSFLGLGVQAPTADWGIMLQEGRQYLLTNPLIALFPGIAIVTIIISINILSDGLQMYWDPKQKKLPYKFSLLSKSTTKLPGTARTQIFSIGQEVSNV